MSWRHGSLRCRWAAAWQIGSTTFPGELPVWCDAGGQVLRHALSLQVVSSGSGHRLWKKPHRRASGQGRFWGSGSATGPGLCRSASNPACVCSRMLCSGWSCPTSRRKVWWGSRTCLEHQSDPFSHLDLLKSALSRDGGEIVMSPLTASWPTRSSSHLKTTPLTWLSAAWGEDSSTFNLSGVWGVTALRQRGAPEPTVLVLWLHLMNHLFHWLHFFCFSLISFEDFLPRYAMFYSGLCHELD